MGSATSTGDGALPRIRELASGVDGLYLSANPPLPPGFLEILGRLRTEASARGQEVPLRLPGVATFGVSGGGFNRYRFCLKHEYAWVGVTDSCSLPSLYVQFRASFLHGSGVEEAVHWLTDVARQLCGDEKVSWTVSRIDLFADFQGWDLSGHDRERFVCRAKSLITHETAGAFSGFVIGKRSSGTVLARIYDKTAKVALDGDRWWLDKWGTRFVHGSPVLRVEFEIHRAVLAECGLRTVDETLSSVGSLWGYATERWLTYRDRSPDATRSRWPVAGVWRGVQGASLREGAIGLERVYAGQQAGSLRKLLPAIRGYLSTVGAVLGESSLERVVARVISDLRSDERKSGVSFESLVESKARRARFA